MFDLNNKFPEYYKFKGRRIAKKISNSNLKLIQNKYDKYSIDCEAINSLSYNKKFHLTLKQDYKKIIIEVGFGSGDYLFDQVRENNNHFYIGSEVYINGLAKALKFISNNDISNLRICGLNFTYLLKVLEKKTIDLIYFINPDPWEKKRHNKRRILNLKNILLMKEKLKSSGKIIVTTDSKDYTDSLKFLAKNNPDLINTTNFTCMNEGDPIYGISKYQRRAISNNKKIYKIEIISI